MKVLIMPSREVVAQRAAQMMAQCVRARADAVLGLATGSTMVPVYDAMVAMQRAGLADFSAVTTFNLDEYVGLAPDHPQSYRQTMERLLFAPLGLDRARTFLPIGDAPDLHAEAARYDHAITLAGGIDLQLLGIGQNGHIGFNEPTSSLGGRTRIKTLAPATRAANARFFADPSKVPSLALTMGIANILEARACLLVATGAAKAGAVARMIEGPLGADCPASALQWHPKATIMLDHEAASGLKLGEYYQAVHPDGSEGQDGLGTHGP